MKNGSPEEDWYRAEQIFRERHRLTSADAVAVSEGNSRAQDESYQVRARSESRSPAQSNSYRERSQNMAQQNQGSWHNQQTSGQSGVMDQVRDTISSSGIGDRVNNAVQSAGEMMQREPMSMPRPEHREGSIARSIEQQTAKIPSDAWLWAAVGSIGLSLALELSGKEKTANFVGHWAPTFLIFGLYNKMVKLQGSDGI